MPPLRLLGRRALRSAGGEPLCSADSVRLCASVVHVPVRPWSPQSQGLPREADAAPVARHLADCMGKTDGAGGGGVSARVPELRRRYPADRVQTVLPVRNHPWPSHCWQPPREKAGGLRSAWCAPKRQEHATHEPLISREMLAEVPLAGLSFRGRHCSLPRRARSRPSPHRGPAGRARVRPPPPARSHGCCEFFRLGPIEVHLPVASDDLGAGHAKWLRGCVRRPTAYRCRHRRGSPQRSGGARRAQRGRPVSWLNVIVWPSTSRVIACHRGEPGAGGAEPK